MADRSEQFLRLSSRLTGFSLFQLRGAGMAGAYLAVLDARVPADLLTTLLAATNDDVIMDDPKLGPIARNLILMWYSGVWAPLPDDWLAAHGNPHGKESGVISAAAYQAGLQWCVAGAHPAGAQQQGFGAWSLPPALPAR